MAKKVLHNWEIKSGVVRKLRSLIKKGGLNPRFYIYRYKFNMYPKKFKLAPFPIDIIVEASATCNIRCDMCFQNSMKLKKIPGHTIMDFNLFKKIIDESVSEGVYSVKISWRGEPMLNEHYSDMILYAKKRGVLELTSLTNATLLTEDMSRSIIDNGLDQLIVSMDGATKETYEAVRKGANFNKVVSNLEGFLRMRGKSKKPFVRLQFTQSELNKHETRMFYDRWAEKVDEISISYAMDYDFVKDGVKKQRDNKDFQFTCPQLWYRLAIMSDGSVSPCCLDVKGMMKLGNVNDMTIKEIWHSDYLNRLRGLHRNNKFHEIPLCKECVHMMDKANLDAGRLGE